jgi:4-amino-4-deoxy-L-arabinose transferase-like glycosyltransferase
LLGFAAAAQGKYWAGLALGTGAGIAFLSKGLLGPGIIGLSATMLFVWPEWRRRGYLFTLLAALIAALPWLCIWPLALYRISPALFSDWLSQNNFGRFLGYAPDYLNAVKDTNFWRTTLWWTTFPLLPLALLSLHRFRADWQQQPAIQIGLVMAIALLGTLAASSTLRAIYALPLLLALALIAAPVLREPPNWFNRLATGCGTVLFVGFALLVWSVWLLLALDWLAPGSHIFGNIIPADLHVSVSMGATLAALALTVFWIVCQSVWRSASWRGGATWYSSLISTLALFALLWLPSIEGRSSYRTLFEQMAHALPTNSCVSTSGLGESQRGMLDYVLQLKVQPESDLSNATCESLLIDSSINKRLPALSSEWSLVWSGRRSPESHEQFWLYTRNHSDIVGLHRNTQPP